MLIPGAKESVKEPPVGAKLEVLTTIGGRPLLAAEGISGIKVLNAP
jgi:hypothetical protein